MARPTKEERLARIHQDALQEFAQIWAQEGPQREECIEDRRFYSLAGAQWEGALGDQFENKAKFEVNKVHLSIIRIFNEYRNNRITVDFVPKPGASDDLADTLDGLYRADEQDSCAEEAKNNAFEEGVSGGIGAWRLHCDYEDDEDDEECERQRVRFSPIYDADQCVFFDLGTRKQDKSDAKRCYVLFPMARADYVEQYGDDIADWPKASFNGSAFDWVTPDVVWMAERYSVEETRDTVTTWVGLDGSEREVRDSDLAAEEDGGASTLDVLRATGFREGESKKVKRRRVHKHVMSGGRIVEDCGYIPGRHIPIVVFYGKRWVVNGVEKCMGHVRLQKDSQRLANMLRSKLAEITAASSIEKPIVSPERMAGHTSYWDRDNIENYAWLPLNRETDLNGNPILAPLEYTKVPQVPPALAGLLQISEQDLIDLAGNQQAGEEVQQNLSGKAVELIQNRLDMQAYIYMSNMAIAEKRSGQIWLSMAKDILVEEGREMKTVGPQGQRGTVELLRPVLNEETGEVEHENDLSRARCEVSVDIGPTSSSKRSATVRALTGMLQLTQDPDTQHILTSMALLNMEGEGLSDVRDYFRRKLLRMGAVKPTPEEEQQLLQEQAGQQQDPQATYLQAAATQAEADAVAKRANAVLSVAKAEETKAKTAETLANMEQSQTTHVLDTLGALGIVSQPE